VAPDGKADAPAPMDCGVEIQTTAEGTLDALHVVLKGTGQDISLDADLNLTPRAAFPLKDALANLQLADGSSMQARVNWETSVVDGLVNDRLQGTLNTDKLNVGQLVGPVIPDTVLTLAAKFDVELRDHS